MLRDRFRQLAWLLPAWTAGTALRLWNLPAQILAGDELHAVRAVLELPFARLLVTYRPQDGCLPLSAFYRLLVDAGVPFSEAVLRAPVLAAGSAMILLAPALAQRWSGRPAAVVFGWLLALSPILTLYSRVARSYAPVALVAFVAAMLFLRWREEPSRWGWAAGYTAAAAFAAYLHLVALPFVLAPLAFAGLEALAAARREGGWQDLRRRLAPLLTIGIGTLAGIACFLVPGWASLSAMMGEKRQTRWPDFETVYGVSRLQSGSLEPALIALFYLAAAVGLVVLVSRRRRFGLLTASLVAGHYLGMAVLRPLNIHLPPQHTRYTLVVLPVLLLWVAAALAAAGSWLVGARDPGIRRRGMRGLLPALPAVAFLVALALTGPFTRPVYRHSQLTHHKDLLGFYLPPARMAPADVPDFYRRLAAEPRPAPVLEYPWHTSWRLARTPYVYQQIHGQRVLVSTAQELLDDPRLGFRNMVPPHPAAFLASPARYLVLHLDWGEREDRVRGDDRSPDAGWKYRYREWRTLRQDAGAMNRRLESLWGPPDIVDGSRRIWDLERLRRQLGSPEARP